MKPQTPENPFESLDPELKQRLDALSSVPDRSPQNASQGRARFLYQAQEMRQAVSAGGKARHKEWIIPPLFGKKEPFRMSTLATLLVILSLVFGGSTATIAAAQSALPDQPLYGLKLISEDVGEKLAFENQIRFELALQFASRRLAEVEKLMLKGETPPDEVFARYQNQMQNALSLAAGLPDEELTPALLRLQETLRQQEQILRRLQELQPGSPLFNQLMAMLQTRLQLVANGLSDPLEFRNQVRAGQSEEFTPPQGEGIGPGPGGGEKNGEPGGIVSPGPGEGTSGGNNNPWTGESPEPGSGFGQDGGNPWTDNTPTPGSGYGYGDGNGDNPWTDGTPTPGSGYGDGGSANPWTSGTPTPGSGYGPGPK
jgi:hypothetical protein